MQQEPLSLSQRLDLATGLPQGVLQQGLHQPAGSGHPPDLDESEATLTLPEGRGQGRRRHVALLLIHFPSGVRGARSAH